MSLARGFRALIFRSRPLTVVVVLALVVTGIQALSFVSATGGSRALASGATGTGGLFVPVQGRILNTQTGVGGYSSAFAASTLYPVAVDGVLTGLPSSGVAAVAVNFTVVNPSAGGNVYAGADGTTLNPTTTFMNYVTGVTESNSAVVPVGSDGQIEVTVSASTNMLIDVQGYYTAGSTAAGGYVPVTLSTIANKVGLTSGSVTAVTVAGAGGVPSSATAVTLDLGMSSGPTGSGYIKVYPDGASAPGVSLNFPGGKNYNWTDSVQLSSAGKIDIYVFGGTINLGISVEGYFTATTSQTGQFTPAQSRVYDSRSPSNPVTTGTTRAVQVAGTNGVPLAGSGITAVAIETAIIPGTGANGHLQVFPDGTTSGVVDQQFAAGTLISMMSIVPVAANGKIDFQNTSPGSINIVVDVEGWYSSVGVAVPSGQTRVTPGGTVTLDGQAYGGSSAVTYQYEVGSTPSAGFVNVPTGTGGDLYMPGSTTHAPAYTLAAGTAYSWDIASSIRSYLSLSGGTATPNTLVQVEACYGTSAPLVCAMPSDITYENSAFGDTYATASIGPGTLSLVDGDYQIGTTDAGAATGLGGLSIGRTLTTLAPPDAGVAPGAQRTGMAGVFGPGWTADVSDPDAGHAGLTVTDKHTAGYLTFTDTDGSVSTYQATTAVSSYPITFSGVGDAAGDGEIVSMTAATTITMTDPDGTVTTWTNSSGVWSVTSVAQPAGTGAAGTTTESYTVNGTGLVTRILAPVPAGVTGCGTAPDTTPGCRSLTFTYQTITVAGTNVTRLQKVSLSLPQVSGTANIVDVAAYDYNTDGTLADGYDPRITPNLTTVYSYDANGRLATLTPPGLSAWTFSYDSSGRVSTISRPGPSGSGLTAVDTVIYGVPLTGTGLPDLTAATAGTWDETSDLPVGGAATAVFSADHAPAGTTLGSVASSDWPYARPALPRRQRPRSQHRPIRRRRLADRRPPVRQQRQRHLGPDRRQPRPGPNPGHRRDRPVRRRAG